MDRHEEYLKKKKKQEKQLRDAQRKAQAKEDREVKRRTGKKPPLGF